MTDLDDVALLVEGCRYYVHHSLQDGEATDDLLQDLFLAMALAPEPRHRKLYVVGGARHMICQWIRARQRARLLLGENPAPSCFKTAESEPPVRRVCDRGDNPEQAVIRAERERDLARRLARLPRVEREIITRVHLDGEKSGRVQREMERALGLGASEYRNRKSRGLDRMARDQTWDETWNRASASG